MGETDLGMAGGGAATAGLCCDDPLLRPLIRDLGAATVGVGSAPPPVAPEAIASGCCKTIPWCWWCLGSDPELALLSLPCCAPISAPPSRGRSPQRLRRRRAKLVGSAPGSRQTHSPHRRQLHTLTNWDWLRILQSPSHFGMNTLPHRIWPPSPPRSTCRSFFFLSPLLLPQFLSSPPSSCPVCLLSSPFPSLDAARRPQLSWRLALAVAAVGCRRRACGSRSLKWTPSCGVFLLKVNTAKTAKNAGDFEKMKKHKEVRGVAVAVRSNVVIYAAGADKSSNG